MRSELAPGLVWASAIAAVSIVAATASPLSSLVIAVILGALWTNRPGSWPVGFDARVRPGARFAARNVLRVGIVLLGLRLGIRQLADLGAPGLAVVVVTVTLTFFGTQWLGKRLGVGPDLSMLLATGYSICGVSAIAAMEPNTDATEEEVAVAIALVTLFGSVSIAALPLLGKALGLDDDAFGSWVGASTHDVAQVVAASSTRSATAVSAAAVVKFTRIALLAPLVAGVSLRRRANHRSDSTTPPPPLLPLFVVGFLIAVAVRSTGWLGQPALDRARTVETVLLTVAMAGLGTGVRVSGLRSLGARPVVLGTIAWVLVAGIGLTGVLVTS